MELAGQGRHVPGDTAKIGHDGRCLGHEPNEPGGRAGSDQHRTLRKRGPCPPLRPSARPDRSPLPERPCPHLPGSTGILRPGAWLPPPRMWPCEEAATGGSRDGALRPSPIRCPGGPRNGPRWRRPCEPATAPPRRSSTVPMRVPGGAVRPGPLPSGWSPPSKSGGRLSGARFEARGRARHGSVSGDVRPSTRLGPRPLTTWTRTTRASGREGSAVYTTPLATASVMTRKSDRHGARCEFVQLSIVDGLGGEEAFDHLLIGIDQPVPLYVEHGKILAGEGVGAVLSDGAGADCHAGRRTEGLREPIVGVQDRILDCLGDRKRR